MPANPTGGTLRVELNHRDLTALPDGMRGDDADHRILAVAANLAAGGSDVALVSKDLPLRLKASVVGIATEDYHREVESDGEWTGVKVLPVAGELIDELYSASVVDCAEGRDLPCHTGVVLVSGSQSALGRVQPDKCIRLVPGDRALFDVRCRSAEQRFALDVLGDDSIGIVSLGGPAGTGGYLPGTAEEKMAPWAAAVFDALDSIAGPEIVEEVILRGQLEVVPLTHLRGRTSPGRSSSSTRRRTSSGPRCSAPSPGSVRAAGRRCAGTLPNATTCTSGATTVWCQSSTRSRVIRCSRTSVSPAPSAARSPRWSPACSTTTTSTVEALLHSGAQLPKRRLRAA